MKLWLRLNLIHWISTSSISREMWRYNSIFLKTMPAMWLYIQSSSNIFVMNSRHCLLYGGNKDPFFLPPGAQAFKRDIPNATVKFFDTGHFALETHVNEIGAEILDFLEKLPE